MAIKGTGTKQDPILVTELDAEEVPPELRPENFFDLETYPFEHRALVDGARSVVDIIGKNGIEKYATEWLAEKVRSAEGSGNVEERTGVPGIGKFKVLVEKGAVCEPLFVHGSFEWRRPYPLCCKGCKSCRGCHLPGQWRHLRRRRNRR